MGKTKFNLAASLKKATGLFRSDQAVDKSNYGSVASTTQLEVGSIYKAVVESVIQPKNTIICIAEGDSSLVIENCVWAAGIFSNLFGFRFNYTPPRGSHVLVLYTGETNYIIGGFLTEYDGDTSGMRRASLGSDQKEGTGLSGWFETKIQSKLRGIFNKKDGNMQNRGGNAPWDMIEGELEISNLLGVGATFMRHIAQLKAGELAKVECGIIDDMVRVISGVYKHHSSFGDYKIYNDGGRLNVRWDGSNADWEAYGKADRKEEKISQGEYKNSLKPPKNNEKINNDAKWRFSQFVGHLGDFINMFVTDPVVWAEGSQFLQEERSGKARVHVNEDGTILLSTVNEFVIEKTPRIIVPLEKLPEYHKDGNKPAEEFLDNLNYLKNWNFNESGGDQNVHYSVYQIREYAKWLSNQHAQAQFLRMDKDWYVPPEAAVPEPDTRGQKHKDKIEANADVTVPDGVKNSYATIKICKDGSIVLVDAYDNSILLSKSGLSLTSHNNVQIEAAGSINMVAGRDINMLANKSIDLTSTKGGLSLRGENFIQQYCRRGGIMLETDQSADGTDIWDLQDNNQADQEDDTRIQGLVLKSNNTHIRLESGLDLGLKSRVNIHSVCGGTCGVYASRFQVNDTLEVYPKSSSNVIKSQDQSLFDASAFDDTPAGEGAEEELLDDARDPGLGYIRVDGFMVAEKMFANFLVQYARNLRPMLCKDNDPDVIAPDPTRKFKPNGSPYCHPFHVLTTNKKKFDTAIEKTDAKKYKEHNSSPKFKHRTIEEYGTIGEAGKNYQSLTQQALSKELQNEHLNKFEYDNWAVVAESKVPGRGDPWPGNDSMWSFNTFKKLWEPDTLDPKSYNNKAEALTDGMFLLKIIKQ